MNLFGKRKTADPPKAQSDPVATINMLKSNLDTIEKREEHINTKMEMVVKEAKQKMAKKDKNGALFCLKRKKMYEGEVAKLQGARLTLEQEIFALESAAVNIGTFKAMAQGANAMQGIRGNIDEEAVDNVMDKIEDESDIAKAIGEAISRPAQDMFGDDELLNELNELDALEEEPVQSAAIPQTVFNASVLPSVPTGAVAQPAASSASAAEEEALRELEASMMLS